MKHGIDIKVWCSCNALNMDDEKTFSITIDEDVKDIIAYLFYKKYDKPYNELSWYLEDGAKEFVKDIEDKWLSNTLDTFSLYQDREFLEFLSERYADEVTQDQMEEFLEEYKDDVKDELDDMEWVDIKYLNETDGPEIDIWVGPLHDSIDLEDYIEDHAWLYEDEEEGGGRLMETNISPLYKEAMEKKFRRANKKLAKKSNAKIVMDYTVDEAGNPIVVAKIIKLEKEAQ